MQTTVDTDLISQLAAAIAKHVKPAPAIPLEIDMWDIATIAAVFKRSESQVRERMACLPDFPKAIRLPSSTAGRGQALYPALEVLAWAKKYRDKN
jgi:hypothetical protein